MRIDFLICSERSGSNLITRLINAHSRICAPATTHLFRLLGENLRGYGDLQDESRWRALVGDAADLLAATLGPWLDDCSKFVALAQSPNHPRSLSALLRTIYEQEAEAAGKRQLFIKEIELFRFEAFLESEFPDARYVYLVRDPRDMALSWKKSAAIRGGVVRAAQAWQRDQAAYRDFVRRLASQHRVVQLTYEQLIQEPESALTTACRELGVEFEPSQLYFHERSDTKALAGAAADFANLQQPLMRDNLHKFCDGLSDVEIAYVEEICGTLMQEFGYERTLPPVTNVDALAEELQPLEPQRKAAYEHVSESERQTRARWVEVAQRIRQRSEMLP